MITLDEIRSSKLLALSWKQPFAALMMLPIPKIETRVWNTSYRGLVLICSSKVPYTKEQVHAISGTYQSNRMYLASAHLSHTFFAPSAALAVAKIKDCRGMLPTDEDKTFVKYYKDLYCHIYEDVTPIKPFFWKGSQGWSEVSEEVKNSIELLEI